MRLRRFILPTVLLIGLSFPLVSLIDRRSGGATDYDVDLGLVQKDIAEAKDRALTPPIEVPLASRFVFRIYQRAILSGAADDFQTAETAINQAIDQIGPLVDLYLLKANLNFRLHRMEKAESDVAALKHFAGDAQVIALNAGLAFQRGRYGEARKGYLRAIEKNPSWDNFARLAYWESKFGDPEIADKLYAQAENELSAKEMRSYAWVELERGLLDLYRGNHQNAARHYDQAGKAYSGYWLADEHKAELLGAERKFDEAIALYKKVIARAPRPEFQQALGDLFLFMGKPAQARPWHDAALAGYLHSAARGEVHYYHHLAGFYADARQDGAEGVNWARKDIALRDNFMTQDALAWALYRDGQFPAAFEVIKKTLDSGVKDPHVFFHAAMIHVAAGQIGEGKRLLQTLSQMNPGYESFHVHR
jgi:tetratricopeptide (TPR) repeat protein